MSHLVYSLGHIKINTPDIDAVVRDATEILGLHVTHSNDQHTWLSSNGRAAELVLVKSPENSCHTVGLEALTVEAVREAETRIEAAGCRVLTNEPSLECIKA